MTEAIQGQAVRIRGKGDVDVLEVAPFEVRAPGPGELRVKVHGAGLNRADILQRKGFYPAPPGAPPDVPGLEFAGTVEALGAGVSGWKEGDPVMGIIGGGGMASHVVVHSREAIPVPKGMSLDDAAAVPEVFLTAYDALSLQGGMALGELVVIHAIGSGVGTAALQLVLASGAHPVGTSRTEDKLARAKELGLKDGLLVAEKGKFAGALSELTGGRGADLILDGVGAAYLADNVDALATCGRLVVIGLLGGAKGELVLGNVLRKRLTLIGTVLRSRPLEEKATLAQRFAHEVVPLFERGLLKPVVDRVFPVKDVAAAHQRMESNESFGKIVLAWG